MKLATDSTTAPSVAARLRLDSGAPPMHLLYDTARVLWLHFTASPEAVGRLVNCPIDVHAGRAWLAVQIETIQRVRPRLTDGSTPLIQGLDGSFQQLTLQVATRFDGQPAWRVLTRFSDQAALPLLAVESYGLPFRRAQLHVDHQHQLGALGGSLSWPNSHGAKAGFTWRATVDPSSSYLPAEPASQEAFLLERYACLTVHRRVHRVAWAWHRPWAQTTAEVAQMDTDWLDELLPGVPLTPAGAHYSPGACDVWWSRPLCVEGAACAKTWGALPSDREHQKVAATSRAS